MRRLKRRSLVLARANGRTRPTVESNLRRKKNYPFKSITLKLFSPTPQGFTIVKAPLKPVAGAVLACLSIRITNAVKWRWPLTAKMAIDQTGSLQITVFTILKMYFTVRFYGFLLLKFVFLYAL